VVVHGTDLGQWAAVGDVDVQLSGVDAADEVGQLRGVAADEDALRAHSSLGILLS
jgi:hypothetical protein